MKNHASELAIFGGKPQFEQPLFVGRPNIGNRDRLLERINDMLDRRWFSNNGPFVQEFEQQIADYLGVKHCIAVSNGTIGLEIVVRALGLEGEVIVPSFTFVATAHALQWQSITPVFCDVDPKTHTLNPCQVKLLITHRTTGIIGVHVWGYSCDIDSLTEIANQNNLKLIFDASHAFGCSYQGKLIGNFGCAEVFSLHATKIMNTFEGGVIATNDDELNQKLHLMKNFGFSGFDNVVCLGINGKMSETSAAMGLTSLESLEEFIEINQRNYKCYEKELAIIPGVKLFLFDEAEKNNYQYIVVEVREAETYISRDLLIKILHAENVIARRYFYPSCHRMEPYRSYLSHTKQSLPVTEKLAQSILILPTGTTVSLEDIKKICNILSVAIWNHTAFKE
jgi:dTDP-4-amino-4,6-dideoxygalactose transaminase